MANVNTQGQLQKIFKMYTGPKEITIYAFIKDYCVMCVTMDKSNSFELIPTMFDRAAKPAHEDGVYDLLVEIVRVPGTKYNETYYGEFKVESYTFVPNNIFYFLNNCINL